MQLSPQEQIERDVWDLQRAAQILLTGNIGLSDASLSELEIAYRLLGKVIEKRQQKDAA